MAAPDRGPGPYRLRDLAEWWAAAAGELPVQIIRNLCVLERHGMLDRVADANSGMMRTAALSRAFADGGLDGLAGLVIRRGDLARFCLAAHVRPPAGIDIGAIPAGFEFWTDHPPILRVNEDQDTFGTYATWGDSLVEEALSTAGDEKALRARFAELKQMMTEHLECAADLDPMHARVADLERRFEAAMAARPAAGQSIPTSIKSPPAAATAAVRHSDADLRGWYSARVADWPDGVRPPSRDDDAAAAREAGFQVSREVVAQIRKDLAPDEWRRPGRRV